ncbi:hypothetical protein CKK33_18755 [Mucilaginibacter sp. MD40]|nr:hypothetical protein CKK33_18755 [Mucilaginibacter sp. MD40]
MSLTLDQYLNTVIEGDCLEVMGWFPDNSIDLILCHLPYGTTINPWNVSINFDRLWQRYRRIIKSNDLIAALTGAELPNLRCHG